MPENDAPDTGAGTPNASAGPARPSVSGTPRPASANPTRPAGAGLAGSAASDPASDSTVNILVRIARGTIRVCRLVPLLPVVIAAALPLALLWDFRPWGPTPWPFNPSLGQWVVILLVAYTVVDTVRGMIDDIRHGHVGVDILAVVAILSTLAVREYWASWAVTLMIASGEAIEEYAQSKAEANLTALMQAAPVTAHVANLPGVGANAKHPMGGRPHADAHSGADAGSHGGPHAGLHDDAHASVSSDGFRRTGAPVMHAHADAPAVSVPASQVASAPVAAGAAVCGITGREAGDCSSVVAQADAAARSAASAAADAATRASAARASAARTNASVGATSPARANTSAARTNTSPASHFDTVPVEQVRLGDVLVVLPGETVPVDGELLSGSATLDLSAINGEPVPREVYAGARVMSGAVNGATTLTMRATELARDSQYQRIMELVSSAQSSRAAVVKTADLLAVPFTVIAFVIAGVAWTISGVPTRFAQVLVLATPCPLLIAAPVAYMAGTGRLARHGILVKAQDVLENLGRVSHVFFDKTGTLTVKRPQVVRVERPVAAARSAHAQSVGAHHDGLAASASAHAQVASVAITDDSPAAAHPQVQAIDGHHLDDDHILMFAGIVETYSVHILAEGIAAAGKAAIARLHARFAAGQRDCPAPESARPGHGRDYPVVRGVREDAGKGVRGEVNGHGVTVGRFAYVMESTGDVGAFARSRDELFPDALAADEMATYVAVDSVLVARLVLKDVPRANAASTMERLRALGVRGLTMLTGDKAASARIIAKETGIDDVHAELFPEDKVAAVRNATVGPARPRPWWDRMIAAMTGDAAGRPIVMMVGDGVNDAPVLAASDIGMAITDGTSTAASESAQVVIMNDDIAGVADAVAIARRTKRIMLQAVGGGLALATVFMIAAAFNLVPVVVGAFIQEGIDVVSIMWALLAATEERPQERRRARLRRACAPRFQHLGLLGRLSGGNVRRR